MTWEDRHTEFTAGLALPDAAAADRLTVWLEGIGMELPPDEPAYPVLFRLGVYGESTERLSELTAALLDQWLAGSWSVAIDFSNAAYNLLHLAAELRDPLRLAGPIWQLYRRRIVEGRRPGVSMASVLLEAMIVNQSGEEPEASDLWKRMLLGKDDEYVGGSVEHGFRGVVHRYPLQKATLVFGLEQVFALDSRVLADDLVAYVIEAHPDHDVGSSLRLVTKAQIKQFSHELTKRRNRTADKLKKLGFMPRDMAAWNRRWRRVVGEVQSDLEKRPPLIPGEREELMTFHLIAQFRDLTKEAGSNNTADVEKVKKACEFTYAECRNLRPPGLSRSMAA